jgi:macrodomain Ter protein organizer (MatP/YcbG family)|tara:strand:- start:870 stop:1031 length:162 start_codon:yes stop_codon:yes gene_type:complete
VLTAKDAFKEMMEDISNPTEVDDWIKKYKLEPDLEIELRKIVAEEIKRTEENG